MELLIIGVVVAANIIFILFKYEKKRFSDAIVDTLLLLIVTILFSGSYAGLVVATIASLLISIYLYKNPPKLQLNIKRNESTIDIDKFVNEFKKRAERRYK